MPRERAVESDPAVELALGGRPSPSQLSAAALRWRRMCRPSTSSASHARRRGHARARDSCATATTPSSTASSRARAKSSTRPLLPSSGSRRTGTQTLTGSPSGVTVTEAQQEVSQHRPVVTVEPLEHAFGRLAPPRRRYRPCRGSRRG